MKEYANGQHTTQKKSAQAKGQDKTQKPLQKKGSNGSK